MAYRPPETSMNVPVVNDASSDTSQGAASARVIPACYATGQAAGTAAALAVRHGVSPRRVCVQELRDVLRRAGAIV